MFLEYHFPVILPNNKAIKIFQAWRVVQLKSSSLSKLCQFTGKTGAISDELFPISLEESKIGSPFSSHYYHYLLGKV